MSNSLPVLREQNEYKRFIRQREDDSRTAIAPDAVRALQPVMHYFSWNSHTMGYESQTRVLPE